MKLLTGMKEFTATVSRAATAHDLFDALSEACNQAGIKYFAISHHADFASSPEAVRVHNYPAGWEDWYDARGLGVTDPIHRASHLTAKAFYWRDVPSMMPLSKPDRDLLDRGVEIGLGDGVTAPANVPGEFRGSCSFVVQAGQSLPENALLWAQTVGAFAFEVARKFDRHAQNLPTAQVSNRQRECIALAGAGLSDRRIAAKLGIGIQSVMEHMREARARLEVSTRTQLVVRLLATGELAIGDVWTGTRR